MYNRYVPQSDGTYQKNRMPDRQQDRPASQGRPSRPPRKENREPEKNPPRPQTPPCSTPRRQEEPSLGVGSFLRQLLPQNFDTEDLLVVILLLLMCGDGGDGQNTALLTLVIYLFL